MRKLLAVLVIATLCGTRPTSAQLTISREMFVVCKVEHATVGLTAPVKQVGGLTGMSFGITYLQVVDTAGRRRTLVYGQPISVWQHTTHFFQVTWITNSSMTSSDLMTLTFGAKWSGGLHFESQQMVTADAVIVASTYLDTRPIEGAIPIQMEMHCGK